MREAGDNCRKQAITLMHTGTPMRLWHRGLLPKTPSAGSLGAWIVRLIFIGVWRRIRAATVIALSRQAPAQLPLPRA